MYNIIYNANTHGPCHKNLHSLEPEPIFVTNITNYICGEKIVMWRNFGKFEKCWEFWETLRKFGKFWEIFPQLTRFHVEKN